MLTDFEALNLNNKIYVLADFAINLPFRDKYVLNKPNETKKIDKDLLPEIRRYEEFCSMFGLSQLINCSTRKPCNTSTLTGYILTNTQEIISQSDLIVTAISFICYTTRIPKEKYNRHKEIIFCSFKNYLADVYKENLEKFHFLIMKTLIILTLHIVIFFTRPDCVMNAIVPFKAVRIKKNASEWFDGETAEKMHTRDKLYKKFKSTKLHVDEEIYKEARNTIQNLILKKKKENTANPKKL